MQMIGAYGIFFLFLVWLARQHLLAVVRQSLFLCPAAGSRSEWFDVRISFWGAVCGFAGIICWVPVYGHDAYDRLPGHRCLFIMIMLVATRIICQGGLAYFTPYRRTRSTA